MTEQTQTHEQITPNPVGDRWTYAESGGLDLPIKPGQIWRITDSDQTQEHIYACYDFMSDQGHAVVRQLLGQYRPTLLYCDPPWGQGLINQFRTKAGLDRAEYSWVDLYNRIVGYVPENFPIWLESGRREEKRILTEVLHRHANVQVFQMKYYGRNPSLGFYAGPTPFPPAADITGLDDSVTPGVVMEAYPKGRVFDPCAGRGGTAVNAARLGWSSLSIELSPYRQSAGLVALREVLHTSPERIR